MFGLVLLGGWPRGPEVRDYTLRLFSDAEQVAEFYDILTEYRFGYLASLQAGNPAPLQQHVPTYHGPATLSDMMSFAQALGVETKDAHHYAYLRKAMDVNPSLRPGPENPGFWDRIRATPLDYLREMLGTTRLATPAMLSRVCSHGVPRKLRKTGAVL